MKTIHDVSPLSKHPYFGGAAFSAADIMMLFPTYPHIIAWRANVESRPARLP